jgi:hypothetical protein
VTNTLLKKGNVLLTGLAMAIGWGIRGNFGHQYGAAFAGCLATITMCLLSGRQDWKSKVLYFAFFGAIGWGFGATISYMQVIGYTDSGQVATQWFGYVSLFIIGFLWASLGVAATALVAVAEPEQLMKLFRVVLFVFGAWLILDYVEDPIANLLQPSAHFDANASRHKNPLYWLDGNYLPPCFALIAACCYDLYNRRQRNILWLPLFAIAGAFAGWLIQYGIIAAGWEDKIAALLTFRLGDPSYIDPATGAPAYTADALLTNWPQWFSDFPHALGWFIGLIIGIIAYFKSFGKFRDGSSLIVYMAGGWLLSFLLFPVLGSLFFEQYGGIRMTPPRSDDWAGIIGVFAGTILWLRKNNYLSVAAASIIGGTIGGLGFSGIQWIRQMMMAPGNPRIVAAKGILPGTAEYENIVSSWANWQHQNWHSFLEQSYGFVNGIAIAITLGLLARRLPANNNNTNLLFKKWITGACAVFTLLIIPYVNLFKNVESWGKTLKTEIWTTTGTGQQVLPAQWDMPYLGRLPFLKFMHLSPEGWFNITWLMVLFIFIALIRKHFQKPLSLIPTNWTGKTQLILLILLWLMVLGNFERELTQWTPERLLTEWVITLDAIILTYFILVRPQQTDNVLATEPVISFQPLYRRAWMLAIAAIVLCGPVFLLTNRIVYRSSSADASDVRKYHLRFGPQADWRAKPILKTEEHK